LKSQVNSEWIKKKWGRRLLSFALSYAVAQFLVFINVTDNFFWVLIPTLIVFNYIIFPSVVHDKTQDEQITPATEPTQEQILTKFRWDFSLDPSMDYLKFRYELFTYNQTHSEIDNLDIDKIAFPFPTVRVFWIAADDDSFENGESDEEAIANIDGGFIEISNVENVGISFTDLIYKLQSDLPERIRKSPVHYFVGLQKLKYGNANDFSLLLSEDLN
jgi:hypothetical protein